MFINHKYYNIIYRHQWRVVIFQPGAVQKNEKSFMYMSTSSVPISMTDLMRHAEGGSPLQKENWFFFFLQIRSNASSADQLKMPDVAAINS